MTAVQWYTKLRVLGYVIYFNVKPTGSDYFGSVIKTYLLAPAVTVGERRELWILPPFFLASSFAYNFVRK